MKHEAKLEPKTYPSAGKIELPQNPSWDRARGYADGIRSGAEASILLGLELSALRRDYYAERSGAGRKKIIAPQGAAQFPKGSDETSPQGAAKCSKGSDDKIPHQTVVGWQAKVRQELGISDDTARRVIERAQVILMLRELREGKSITYAPNGRPNDFRTLEPTPDAIEHAEEALKEIEAGTVSAPRAWAGLVGESSRRGAQGGVRQKAQTDHAVNLLTALKKLKTSLKCWRKIDPESRAEIEKIWWQVVELLPDTWEIEGM